MLTFRQKIIASYATLYVLFLLIMFVVVRFSVGAVVRRAMSEQATELITAVEEAGSINQAIQLLRGRERTYFFRVGLLDSQGHILYDSKARKLFGPAFNPLFETNHPEVIEALEKGTGYAEDYSTLFSQKFAYLAQSFELRGKTYVIRLAFPFRPIEAMTRDFELGVTGLVSLVLFSFALLNGLVINRLVRPVDQIIRSIEPYQRGEIDLPPQIPLSQSQPSTEFDRLSDTLNRLNQRVRLQIETLRDERNERNALLESLNEGVIAIDRSQRLLYLNSAARRLIGCPPPESMPCAWQELHCSQRPLLERAVQMGQKVLEQGAPLTETYERSMGGLQVVQVMGSGLKESMGALIVLQDITSAVQVLRIGKDFVANASHELRTPITIIRGFAETLHEHQELDREAREQMTAKILRNCLRMEVLIQNLLLLADIEHLPEDQRYPFDLKGVVEESIANITEIHPQVQITFEEQAGHLYMVRGSPDLLELCVMNLLTNAVKYSPEPAQITLRLQDLHHSVILEIQDAGIGIPEADLPHIFNRFYTVDKARSRKLGGAGLGLAIVKSIIQKHQGSIVATSLPGQGTTFTITLPRV